MAVWPQLALRQGDWKLVKARSSGSGDYARTGKATVDGAQLYNLREDLGEKNNLAASQPKKLQELVLAWEKLNAEMIDPLWRDGSAERGTAGQGAAKPLTE